MKNKNRMPLPLLVGAVAFLLLGLGLFLWPDVVIGAFPILIGIVLLLVGAQNVAHSLVLSHKMMDPGFRLVQGLITLLVGIVFLVKQDVSLAFLSILFGVYVIASSAIELSGTLENIRAHKPFVLELISNLLGIVLGILLLFSPFSGRSLWVRVLGIYFIFAAATMLHAANALRKKMDEKESDTSPENKE